jgi:ADP-ribose pyrophosphatase
VGAAFEKGAERVVHNGSIITVAVGEFTSPDGRLMRRDLVHHPGAVSVVPVIGDDVILVRQYRAAIDGDLLEIPAGLRDVTDEPPETTAERELAEEIGMHPGKLELLCRFYNAAGFSDEEIFVYLGTDLEPVESRAHGVEEEHMTVERMPLDDALALIDSGELRDAKSIIGLLMLAQRRAGR